MLQVAGTFNLNGWHGESMVALVDHLVAFWPMGDRINQNGLQHVTSRGNDRRRDWKRVLRRRI